MLLDSWILATQLAGVLVYCASLWARVRLPSSLPQSYSIYNDLADAPARPLLPHKQDIGYVLANATGYSGLDGLIECGVDITSVVPPADIPRWALKTDNTGLNSLVQRKVRFLVAPWCFVVLKVACTCCERSFELFVLSSKALAPQMTSV
jgi:hypothetical protein